MHQYVIDASIVVKWFSEEPRRERALELSRRAKLGHIMLYAPELLLYEVGNVLWKGKRFNVQQLQRALVSLLKANITFIPLQEDLIESAAFLTQHTISHFTMRLMRLSHTNIKFLLSLKIQRIMAESKK